ncbi:MAG: serine protease [Novosphingobium sp.]
MIRVLPSPMQPLLLALLALLAPAPARAEASDIASAARSVVRVVLLTDDDGRFALEGHGSGVAVGPDLVVTNAHVVEPARGGDHIRIGVVPPEGKSGSFARIVAFAPDRDLALLKLSEPLRLPVATLFTGPVGDGEDVFAVGYPGNVDLAQGLGVGDIVSPTSPVKTRGSISSGRSSKAYQTILHTAPLGAGNSGGPLLDSCGRVLGVNSFGTVFSGGDSEFYFAVSTPEIMRFLVAVGVKPRSAGNPCRSIAELDQAEAARSEQQRARSDAAERNATASARDAAEQALHQALFEIAEERENWLGAAGIALLLALGAGAGAWSLRERDRIGEARAAAGASALLLLGVGAAMLSRPGFGEVDSRARLITATSASALRRPAPARTSAPASGALVCALLPERSRVTVSPMDDVLLDWSSDGCVAGQEQYGLGADGWFRLLIPDNEDTVMVSRFDPVAAEYRIDRYYIDSDTLADVRAARARIQAPACGASDEAAARSYGEALGRVQAMLPGPPNERLVYHCAPRGASPQAPPTSAP